MSINGLQIQVFFQNLNMIPIDRKLEEANRFLEMHREKMNKEVIEDFFKNLQSIEN